MTKAYLSAQEAAEKLGVSVSTLYAYVSRGLIRSEGEPRKRRRRYRAEDVELLLARKQDKVSSEQKLSQALSWGEPICDSELTLIDEGELYYRGQSVRELVQSSTFDDVKRLLWEGEAKVSSQLAVPAAISKRLSAQEPIERFSLILPWAALEDAKAVDLRPEAVRATGQRILQILFSTICPLSKSQDLVGSLAAAWCPGHRRELEAALILCADHELNVSAFTARCVASSGATPYAVVSAGLAALSGFRHGGHAYRVEALFRETAGHSPRDVVHSYLRRGAYVPGFSHPLYPDGDPRGRDLLAQLGDLSPEATELIEAADEFIGEKPNIDFALVALCRQLSLPKGAAIGLFALGRCVGWIAHAIEQYKTRRLIRPRARYVGPLP